MGLSAEMRGQARRRRRTRPWPQEVTERIRQLAADEVSGPEIRRALEREFHDTPLPEVRTIQGIAADVAQPDNSAVWTLAGHTGSADDAALVMAVLGDLENRRRLEGRHEPRLTVDEATWIVRITRAVPGLAPAAFLVYVFARQYIARLASGEDTSDLDRKLALGAIKGQWGAYVPEEDE